MSDGNAQAARDYLDAFNRGDIDTGLKHFDRYAVVRFDPKWPENRPRFGIEEIRSYFEDLIATFGTGDGPPAASVVGGRPFLVLPAAPHQVVGDAGVE